MFRLVFGLGISSALLMNDTMAVVAESILIILSLHTSTHQLKAFTYASAFSITIGSVMSPIGNPQNILIAQHMNHGFAWFVAILSPPTLACLYLCYRIMLSSLSNLPVTYSHH